MLGELPLELFAIILSFLDRNELFRYVTVSRLWQHAIERYTFREIYLKSTDTKYFSDKVVGHRRTALKKLNYHVILPTYSDHHCAKFETKKDKQMNNEALTESIHQLFSILRSWNQTASEGAATCQSGPFLSLTLDAYSMMDICHRNSVDFNEQRMQSQVAGGRQDLVEHRYEHSFLQVLRIDELPELPCISQFHSFRLYYRRRIEGSSLAGIAARLPNLQNIFWAVNDDEKKYPSVRQQHRFDFAQSLRNVPLQSIRKVMLNLHNEAPCNQNFKLQSALLPSSPSIDQLSLALYALSQAPVLTDLTVCGVISPTFFWPEKSRSTDPPFWPHLRHLEVQLNETTPDGKWLYVKDPEDSDDEDMLHQGLTAFSDVESEYSVHSSDSGDSLVADHFDAWHEAYRDGSEPCYRFRKMLNPRRINPMLMAMARAARHMPKVQRLVLCSRRSRQPGLSVSYLAPGQEIGSRWEKGEASWEEEELAHKRWRILSNRASKWTPTKKLEEAWRAMGSTTEEVIIKIDEFSWS